MARSSVIWRVGRSNVAPRIACISELAGLSGSTLFAARMIVMKDSKHFSFVAVHYLSDHRRSELHAANHVSCTDPDNSGANNG